MITIQPTAFTTILVIDLGNCKGVVRFLRPLRSSRHRSLLTARMWLFMGLLGRFLGDGWRSSIVIPVQQSPQENESKSDD